jgi:hypothetical protein
MGVVTHESEDTYLDPCIRDQQEQDQGQQPERCKALSNPISRERRGHQIAQNLVRKARLARRSAAR